MNRRAFLVGLGATPLAAAAPALAASFTDSIVAELRRQGFSDIDVSRTLLGRVRITALSSQQSREIIVNPRTGEILRDYWQATGAADATDRPVLDSRDDKDKPGKGKGNSGQGGGKDDNEDDGETAGHGGGDDDDDDKDKDDGNSGRGEGKDDGDNGNSGHGGGGNGS